MDVVVLKNVDSFSCIVLNCSSIASLISGTDHLPSERLVVYLYYVNIIYDIFKPVFIVLDALTAFHFL